MEHLKILLVGNFVHVSEMMQKKSANLKDFFSGTSGRP